MSFGHRGFPQMLKDVEFIFWATTRDAKNMLRTMGNIRKKLKGYWGV
jgi:hypothetical protein